jgi:hypothetical protein
MFFKKRVSKKTYDKTSVKPQGNGNVSQGK